MKQAIRLVTILSLTTAVAAQAPLAAQEKVEKNKKFEATHAASQLAEEKGKFRILLDGQPLGTEEFEIKQAAGSWQVHGTTEIRMPNGKGSEGTTPTMRINAQLHLAPDGAPLHYEWSAQAQKKNGATVEFQGGTARLAVQQDGTQVFAQELSFGQARLVILDNNLYHHYAILARLYDWNAKGEQTFAVLIPQDVRKSALGYTVTPGSITVEAAGEQNVEGTSYELLRVRTPDLEIQLYLDSSHRLVRLAVPAAKAVVLREQ